MHFSTPPRDGFYRIPIKSISSELIGIGRKWSHFVGIASGNSRKCSEFGGCHSRILLNHLWEGGLKPNISKTMSAQFTFCFMQLLDLATSFYVFKILSTMSSRDHKHQNLVLCYAELGNYWCFRECRFQTFSRRPTI